MAAQLTTVLTNLFIIQQWKLNVEITELNSQNLHVIQTPGFLPLFKSKIEFNFEVLYQSIKIPNENDDEYDLLKINLKKRPDSTIPLSLEMDVDVAVYYSDKSLFQRYKPLFSVNVAIMDTINFEDLMAPLRWLYIFNSFHYIKMKSKRLMLECNFKFYDYSPSSAVLHYHERESLTNLRTFNRELGLFYKFHTVPDVILSVDDDIFPTHKVIISAHSTVFKEMVLSGSMPSVIEMKGVPYKAVHSFLEFMYTGEIEDKSWHIVKELYALANRYEVETLKRECIYQIVSSLNFDLVCEILQLAYAYDDEKLKKDSKHFAITHYQELQFKKEWKELIASFPQIGYEIIDDFILKSDCKLIN